MPIRQYAVATPALAFILFAGCAPPQQQEAAPAPGAAPTQVATDPASAAPLTRNEIREAQTLLVRLGFGGAAPDGIVGPRSRAAAEAFQHHVEAPATGEFDRRLLVALRIVAEESGVATVPAPPPVTAPGA